MRKAFIDLGANVGAVAKEFAENNPDHDIYCIEANERLIGEIHRKAFEARRTFITMWAAAWTYDGLIDLFESSSHPAATIVRGKVERDPWPQIDYQSSSAIPCFDFSQWLLRTFGLEDDVTVKMDVEGAEYELLNKMILDRSILLVRKLVCEWHYDRFPSISLGQHNAIRSRVAALTDLVDWT